MIENNNASCAMCGIRTKLYCNHTRMPEGARKLPENLRKPAECPMKTMLIYTSVDQEVENTLLYAKNNTLRVRIVFNTGLQKEGFVNSHYYAPRMGYGLYYRRNGLTATPIPPENVTRIETTRDGHVLFDRA